MAETSVIREFLVALGFKADEVALKRFDEGIGRATRAVVGLALAIETTAVAVAAGVARFASNLEALYFASQRTGTSVQSLKAFSMAIQDFGGSTENALASVDALKRYFRDNPSAEGILNSFLFGTGHTVADAKGDMVTLETFLGDMFRRNVATGQQYRNAQIASMLGIDERTMLALQNASFDSTLERFRRENSGIDWTKAAQDAHVFEEQMRDLRTLFEVFVGRVGDGLLKAFHTDMAKVTAWLQNPGNAAKVGAILKDIVDWAGKVADFIGKAIDKFQQFDKATDGWGTKGLAILAVLKLFGGAEIITGVLGLAGAVGALGTALAALAAVATGTWLGTWIDKHFPAIERLGDYIGNKLADMRDTSVDGVQRLTSLGFTQAQATGIVANLRAESGLDPHAVGDSGTSFGLAQWHDPKHLLDFEKQYGHSIASATEAEQYEFLARDVHSDPRLMALLNANRNSAGASAEIFSRFYERPKAGEAEALRRGNAAEQIYQTINITIRSTDPKAAGDEVAKALRKISASTTRNAVSVAQ